MRGEPNVSPGSFAGNLKVVVMNWAPETGGLDPRCKKAPSSLPVSVTRFSHWDASEPGKVLVRATRSRQCRLWFFLRYCLRVEAVVRNRSEQGYHQPPRPMCVTRLPSLGNPFLPLF